MLLLSQKLELSALAEVESLEKLGKYEDALNLLRSIGEDLDETEKKNLPQIISAELNLRFGATIGYYGSLKQVKQAQEHSKNLLTKSHEQFLNLYNVEKAAECENFIAAAYLRMGSYSEAFIWIKNALNHNLNNTNPIKCHSHVLFQNWLLSQNEYQKVIELKNLGKYFNNTELWLKGSFYANVGLAYQNTGNNTKAIEYLLIAKRCHKNQNLAYLGIVENNLALAYANLGDHNQAHLRIDSSINICKQTGDLRRLGSSLDTKSNIFLLESKYDEALQIIETAFQTLRVGEDYRYLADIYLTKIKILIKLNKIAEALEVRDQAVEILRTYLDLNALATLNNEFEKQLLQQLVVEIKVYESESNQEKRIKCELPKPHNLKNCFLIHMQSKFLQLEENSYLLAVNETAGKGDLVAVEDSKNNVFVGFFDFDFGIVCLTKPDEEPLLFDENSITILGKVTAYGKIDNEKITLRLFELGYENYKI